MESRAWLTSMLLVALPLPASATLGGDLASVRADQMRMEATLQTASAGAFMVHELQTPSGTVVREYTSLDGKVFAVAWQGPALPDLQQVLGTYFEQYTEAARTRRADQRPGVIQLPGLIVQSGGHMRAFFGRAYVPQMLPQGVSADQIQ